MSAARAVSLTGVDEALLRGTRRALGGTVAVPVARALSLFGEHALGWIAVGAVGWVTGRRRRDWGSGGGGGRGAPSAGCPVAAVETGGPAGWAPWRPMRPESW